MLLHIFSLLFILVVFGSACLWFYGKYGEKGENKYLFAFPSLVGLVVSIIAAIWLCIILATKGYAFFERNITFQQCINEKSLTQRLLMEDYNPSNLEKALVFNNNQKLIKVENSHWLTAYGTSFVYTDTIAIPATNYMPAQKIAIDVK